MDSCFCRLLLVFEMLLGALFSFISVVSLDFVSDSDVVSDVVSILLNSDPPI